MSKVLIDRAVVEQALKALERSDRISGYKNNCAETVALRTALGQPQVEQEPAPNGATHRQPKQGAFYKRVDNKWYVWSRMENGEPHRWYISPGTAESCLEPIYTHPQPPRQPLTDEEIDGLLENVIGSLPVARKLIRAVEAAHGIKEHK